MKKQEIHIHLHVDCQNNDLSSKEQEQRLVKRLSSIVTSAINGTYSTPTSEQKRVRTCEQSQDGLRCQRSIQKSSRKEECYQLILDPSQYDSILRNIAYTACRHIPFDSSQIIPESVAFQKKDKTVLVKFSLADQNNPTPLFQESRIQNIFADRF